MKKHYALYAIILCMGMRPEPSHALFGTANAAINFSYACLGLDGLPISSDALISQCCDGNGNLRASATDVCSTSLYGAGTAEASGGTGSSLTIAQQTLTDDKDLSGATTSLSIDSTPTSVGNSNTNTSGALSSAITSGSGSSAGSGTSALGSGASDASNLGATGSTGAATAGGQSGGAQGSGGSGSGDSGTGTTGSGKGNESKSAAASSDGSGKGEDAAGKYSAISGAGGNDSGNGGGANGKVGGLFGSLFGNSGKAGTDTLNDAKFGDQTSDSLAAKEVLEGTRKDPGDYFNRIDRSASIFKVVSARYAKEKEKKHIGLADSSLLH